MTEPERKFKILYVCPWAHWPGHHPDFSKRESLALFEQGMEINICTFRGILDQQKPQIIPQKTVVSSWIGFPLGVLAYLLHLIPGGRYLAGSLEQFATLCLAVNLRKTLHYDVIYLRDGDPFIFFPFILGLFLKHYNWTIVLVGQKVIYDPDSLLSSLFSRLINAPFWKPIFLKNFSNNRFAFTCENECIKKIFETKFLDGILAGRITVVPLGLKKTSAQMPQKKARKYLGLPEDRSIFLHFGILHPAKDVKTIIAAIEKLPDVLLVHAGKIGTGTDLARLVNDHGLQDKVIIKDCYIPETEKQYYFAAADAIILAYTKDFLVAGSMLWQAARFRLPAISSDNADLGEMVRKYGMGLVFHAEDVASLNRTLLNFLDSSHSQRETMSNNCKHFCDEFSFDNWSLRCTKIFTDLCGQTGKKNETN